MLPCDVIIAIINHNTKRLTEICIDTFLDVYPGWKMLIIDNGSDDIEFIEKMCIQKENVIAIFNQQNLTHGPAMHQAIMASFCRFILFLDSDCVVRRSGFIEEMRGRLIDNDAYAIGNVQQVDKNGINISKDKDFIKYIHPSIMMIDKSKYHLLPPFIAHGAPGIENMRQANKLGFGLLPFPVEDYVVHLKRGTREGLNVGWDGKKVEERKFYKKWIWKIM